MKRYPNRLQVQMFDSQHQKVTKADREKSREARKGFTNLYVEKLPYAFQEKDVYELFQKYGTVVSLKCKKPNSNVRLQMINSLPYSAFVNFAT